MEQDQYAKAVETLDLIVTGMGAGLAVWGIINLLDGYEEIAARKELIEETRRRVSETNLIMQHLIDDNAAGKISNVRYQKMYAQYEAEQDALIEAIREMEAENAAQSKWGLTQFLDSMSFLQLYPLSAQLDKMFSVPDAPTV